jgi:hypothetical protein
MPSFHGFKRNGVTNDIKIMPGVKMHNHFSSLLILHRYLVRICSSLYSLRPKFISLPKLFINLGMPTTPSLISIFLFLHFYTKYFVVLASIVLELN